MRKTIIATSLILATIFCKAQTKDSVVVNDSIPVLSINQVNNVMNQLQKVMTIDQGNLYKYIISLFQAEIDKSIADKKKNKK